MGWRTIRERVCVPLENLVLPFGMFCMLFSISFVTDRGGYAAMFYGLVAIPTVVLAACQSRRLAPLWASAIFPACLAFACWVLLSLFWGHPDDALISLIKRPLWIVVLFVAIFLLSVKFERFKVVLTGAAILITPIALGLLWRYFGDPGAGRLSGFGILANPLLVSHVFGFYAAFWLACLLVDRSPSWKAHVPPLAVFSVLLCLLFATGSRTPLVALSGTAIWLALLKPSRATIGSVLGIVVVAGFILFFSPDIVLQRGVSYRPQIWSMALQQGLESFWFGHGFGTPLSIQVPGIAYAFSDPHNRTLSVFYRLGIVGVVVWSCMYLVAFAKSWRWRDDRWVVIFSATVAYGLVAGMTEGGGFMTKPNEHWFVIWIPLALLAARVALLNSGRLEVEHV